MKNRTIHEGTLHVLERLPSSVNGNPRYRAEVDGFKFNTQVDSSSAYSLPNHDEKRVRVVVGTHYGTTQLDTLWPLYK